jgi:hypothetical protein
VVLISTQRKGWAGTRPAIKVPQLLPLWQLRPACTMPTIDPIISSRAWEGRWLAAAGLV